VLLLEAAAENNITDELARVSRVQDPGISGFSGNLDNLKRRHAFLNEYTDEDLEKYSLATLLKLEATSIKLKNLENNKAAEVKLSSNRDSLDNTYYKVQEGQDNRWSDLHDSRFLPGWGCTSQKMWSRGREVVKNNGYPAIATYDMASVGLAGHVTNQGWVALHNPGSSNLAIRMFSINNCGRRLSGKSDDNEDNLLADIAELGELKLAMRVLKEAITFVRPWDKSVAALDGFLYQTNYCSSDTENLEKKAELMAQFIDYVMKENSNRWKGREQFLSITELKGTWDSFFGSRPQGQLAKAKQNQGQKQPNQKGSQSQQQGGGMGGQQQVPTTLVGRFRIPQAFFNEDICVMYNVGKCVKAPNNCSTKTGKKLRHICNWRPFGNPSLAPCGLQHAAVFYH